MIHGVDLRIDDGVYLIVEGYVYATLQDGQIVSPKNQGLRELEPRASIPSAPTRR
jgi:hypothetical protein